MSRILLLFCLIGLILAKPADKSKESNESSEEPTYELTEDEIRIIHGRAAKTGEVPYVVSLHYMEKGSESKFCGGSIISPDWILTAAHCVDELLKKDRKGFIVAGEVDLTNKDSKTRQEADVARFINHPGWNKKTMIHDIALLKLKRPLKMTAHVMPIALPPRDLIIEQGKPQASGWGIVDAQTKGKTKILQTIEIPIMKNKDCKTVYFKSLLDTNICAGNRRGVTCRGDSGGPLAMDIDDKWTLIGITSWGTDDPCDRTPGVFTRVSAYVDWVSKETGLTF